MLPLAADFRRLILAFHKNVFRNRATTQPTAWIAPFSERGRLSANGRESSQPNGHSKGWGEEYWFEASGEE